MEQKINRRNSPDQEKKNKKRTRMRVWCYRKKMESSNKVLQEERIERLSKKKYSKTYG